MMTDPVVRHAHAHPQRRLARHERTEVPASLLKKHIAEILKAEGFIADVRQSEGDDKDAHHRAQVRARSAERHRRHPARLAPGRRVYVRHDHIPRVLSGMGVAILSTSRGVMSDKEARRQKVGGELLCEVW